MDRINPTDCKEFRLKQAMAAIEFVGYEFLSSSDRQQVERLWYVDDLMESQYLQQCHASRQALLRRQEKIAVCLGYKPTELYKPHVLNAVMNVRGEEYAKEINDKIQWKKLLENRLSGANVEKMREQSKQELADREPKEESVGNSQLQGLSEFTTAMYKPINQRPQSTYL